jgi:hypothetical protein
MMKTIRTNQIESLTAEEIRPGHILPDGVVLGVHTQDTKAGKVFFFDTPHASVWANAGQQVQVLAKVSEEAAEAIRKTHRTDTRYAQA